MMEGKLARMITAAVAKGISGNEDIHVELCNGGGNNRVFAVTVRGTALVAKKYFVRPGDTRDRFGAEVEFLRYACTAKVSCVPRLLYADAKNQVALFERVEGRRLLAGEVSRTHVREALAFFADLNRPEFADTARYLPMASDACFSLAEHLGLVERRVARLLAIPEGGKVNGVARAWVAEALLPRWEEIKRATVSRARAADVSLDIKLPASNRCVSPSDFGFHNALLRPSGHLCFLDFEYAGWDDPAKMASDFFCQPEVPVPLEFREEFLATALGGDPSGEAMVTRARLLFPVYQIKWICIILNDFLPELARRRRFSAPEKDPAARKSAQLRKAHGLFDQISL